MGPLSKEHVPPQSVGGHELLLTCARRATTRREPSWTRQQRPTRTYAWQRRAGPTLSIFHLGDMTFYERLAITA
jgi:hypothetical protein